MNYKFLSDSMKRRRARKISSVSSSPRKLSLVSEGNDQSMVDLGNAIRSGYADYVYELIEENKSIGYSSLYRLGFQFETSLRRLPMEEEPNIINRLIQGYICQVSFYPKMLSSDVKSLNFDYKTQIF